MVPIGSWRGASSRTLLTRRRTCSASSVSSAAIASRSCCRRRRRPRRSSLASGSWARSCFRCRCSTATTRFVIAFGLGREAGGHGRGQRAAFRRLGFADALLEADTFAGASTEPVVGDTSAEDPAQLYYTSGTTGLAKGIVHAHRYILGHEEFVQP